MVGRVPARVRAAARAVSGSIWTRLLGTAAGLLLFVHGADLGAAASLLGHVDPLWTVLAVTLAGLSVVASVIEWGVFLRGTGHGLDWDFLGGWYLKGLFVNQVLPAGVGSDAMRALRLGRITGHGEMVASLVASRMAGTLAMSMWALAAACFFRELLRIPAFTGFVVFAFFMLVAWTLALLAESARLRIPERWRIARPVARFLAPFTATFHEYARRPTLLVQSCVAGGAAWGLNLFSMVAFSYALGAGAAWQDFALALPVALLATFVPVSANGIGVREAVLVGLLVRAGVAVGPATALGLFVDLQMVPFAVAGGAVFLLEHRIGRLRRHRGADEQAPTRRRPPGCGGVTAAP